MRWHRERFPLQINEGWPALPAIPLLVERTQQLLDGYDLLDLILRSQVGDHPRQAAANGSARLGDIGKADLDKIVCELVNLASCKIMDEPARSGNQECL